MLASSEWKSIPSLERCGTDRWRGNDRDPKQEKYKSRKNVVFQGLHRRGKKSSFYVNRQEVDGIRSRVNLLTLKMEAAALSESLTTIHQTTQCHMFS
jgi:hypothetical protein